MSQYYSKRIPKTMHQGLHQPMSSLDEWVAMRLADRAATNNPSGAGRPCQLHELKSVGKCWVCWEMLGITVNLRQSTGGSNHYTLLRCAALQDLGARDRASSREVLLDVAQAAGLELGTPRSLEAWRRAHKAQPADRLAKRLEQFTLRLRIPEEWHIPIQARYLHDDGIIHYQGESVYLNERRLALEQAYARGEITLAELALQKATIAAELRAFWQRRVSRPAQDVLPLLQDFPVLWRLLNPMERNNLLRAMYAAVYFDAQGRIRWILAHSPFDRLIGLPEGGQMFDG